MALYSMHQLSHGSAGAGQAQFAPLVPAAYRAQGTSSIHLSIGELDAQAGNPGRQMPLGYTGSRAFFMATSQTTVGPFVNEPITHYRKPENVRGMRQAIEKVRAQLGREYDLVIGGEHIRTNDKIVSVNPANPSEVIGIHQKAGLEHVEPAMQAALAAFAQWQHAGTLCN